MPSSYYIIEQPVVDPRYTATTPHLCRGSWLAVAEISRNRRGAAVTGCGRGWGTLDSIENHTRTFRQCHRLDEGTCIKLQGRATRDADFLSRPHHRSIPRQSRL